MAEGRAQVAAGSYRAAIDTYRQAVAADDASHAARHNLALCFLSLGEHASALENVNRALQKGGSGTAKYFSTKATILLALRRREEAVDCVKAGLALDPAYANLKEHAALKAGSGGSSSGSSGGGSGGGGGGGGSAPASSHHAQGMAAVLGPTLLRRDGSSVPTAGALKATRLTLIYYSAKWCGPCRQFSPALSAWAKANAAALSFEVVFASLDKSQEEATQWFKALDAVNFCVPYGRGEELAATYRVAGVPSLLVLCGGVLVTAKGVEGVASQKPFPWVWGGERVGRLARVAGLEKAAHLNGRRGLVVGAVEASGRYAVKVEGEEGSTAIKRENLEWL